MMAAALAARGILEVLRPKLAAAHAEPVARIVIGTVKGDLHDIGKNLVCMMMEGAGFEVIDLGPDVPAEKFIAAIQEHRPEVVGLSALLTTTAPMMRIILRSLQQAGVRDGVKVLVGGAAVSAEFADEIGADGYAPDAGAAVRKAKELLAVTA
jgi:5-methyltetrahydrofolate--homocysteine methyltransferase